MVSSATWPIFWGAERFLRLKRSVRVRKGERWLSGFRAGPEGWLNQLLCFLWKIHMTDRQVGCWFGGYSGALCAERCIIPWVNDSSVGAVTCPCISYQTYMTELSVEVQMLCFFQVKKLSLSFQPYMADEVHSEMKLRPSRSLVLHKTPQSYRLKSEVGLATCKCKTKTKLDDTLPDGYKLVIAVSAKVISQSFFCLSL